MGIAEQFGANLLRARKRSGLSQEALAMRASLHRTHIGLLERGERLARIDTAVKLAAALDVAVDDLLKGIAWESGEAQPGRFTLSGELPCGHA